MLWLAHSGGRQRIFWHG